MGHRCLEVYSHVLHSGVNVLYVPGELKWHTNGQATNKHDTSPDLFTMTNL